MMDDDKKTPEGFDESFEEHELDLNTPEDLNPIEGSDFDELTFEEPASKDAETESLDIFDEFNDSNDFSAIHQEQADAFHFDEPVFDELETVEPMKAEKDEPSFEDNFDFTSTNQENLATDEDMFTSDAFEDVNSDFPEGETGGSLGDSQLFDYDPSAAGAEGEIDSEEIYGAPAAPTGGDKGGKPKGPKGPGLGGMFKNRRVVRVVVMLVLAGAVYGVLRFFTVSSDNTFTNVAAPQEVKQPSDVPSIAASSAPEISPSAESSTPELAAAPETSAATPEMPDTSTTPAMPTTPEAVPPIASTSTTPTTPSMPSMGQVPAVGAITPTQTAPSTSAMNQQPQTSMQVPATSASTTIAGNVAQVPPVTSQTGGQNDQITHKLDSLEASIAAIDNRLASIASHGGGTAVRGAQAAGPGNAFGTAPAPESHEILMQTLHKIEGIDKKMSYLSELETQVHILNKEVSALKNDVVQQSIIVGQNQAHINQNLIAAIDANAPKMIVQAAIPGRAWLRSETGQLITVIPGDEVAGYGRVMSIDPASGTVTMSSRAVFREQ